MAKRNKKNNNRPQPKQQSQPQVSAPVNVPQKSESISAEEKLLHALFGDDKKEMAPLEKIVDAAKQTTNEKDFNMIREALVKRLEEDIKVFEEMKEHADQDAVTAQVELNGIKKEIENLTTKKKALQSDYTKIKEDYDAAVLLISTAKEDASRIRENAKKDYTAKVESAERIAGDTIAKADRERLQTIADANEKARKAWQKQAEELARQIEAISEKEQELLNGKLELEKKRSSFEFEKEALEEMKAYLEKKRERYEQTNPGRIEELELEVKEIEEKYQALRRKYSDQTERLNDALLILDEIKGEVKQKMGIKKRRHLDGLSRNYMSYVKNTIVFN